MAVSMAEAPPDLGTLAGRWQEPDVEADFALPVIVNSHGLVQVAWGPAGIQNWIMPPTGLPTATGRLYRLDGDGPPRPVGPGGTRYRWAPWEVSREHDEVSVRTRLHPGDAAVTERLTFHRAGRYVLLFGGLCRTWSFTDYWNLPADDVPQLNVRWDGRSVLIDDCKTFGFARITPKGPPVTARTHLSLDDFYAGRALAGSATGRRPPVEGPVDRQDPDGLAASGRGRLVALEFEVVEGAEVSWTAVQGADPDLWPAGDDDGAEAAWRELWCAAFTPGSPHFGGHLPALRFGDDALDRLYYMGILTLLHSRRLARPVAPRAQFATGGQAIWAGEVNPLTTAYTWGGSEGAPTTSFLWELQLQAPLLARLDPQVLRDQVEAFLRADMSSHWGIDVLTGRGVGMYYGVNDGAIVSSAADYLRITGDRGWLDTEVAGRTVRQHLLDHVRRHERLAGGAELADYGAAQNLLECVSSYEHQVASFNAMAAWAYRFAAEWLAPECAAEFTAQADRIQAAVLALLRPDGVFVCRTPDGDRVVRTCLDFIYVGLFLGERLDASQQASMLRFFTGELETADWMLALSLRDEDSQTAVLPAFQSFRADHQSTGSYDGWPGLAARVRLSFGDRDATLDWLRRIGEVTWEGPFGQAHWVGTTEDDRRRPARKASFFNGNCYLEACGCTLATTLLEVLETPGSERG